MTRAERAALAGLVLSTLGAASTALLVWPRLFDSTPPGVGRLVAARCDGPPEHACSVRTLALSTGQIGKLSQPGGPLYGIEHSNDGLITFPGGLPIVDKEGVLIGAIGVSGSSVENDHKVAAAGVKPVGVSDLPEHPWRT